MMMMDDEPFRHHRRHRHRHRKLVLVLDLDHTLIHTTRRRELSRDESYLLRHPDLKRCSNPNTEYSLFALDPYTITKLRPFARTFLHDAGRLFDMYIYTRATRQYADAAADILDPGRRRYFRSPSKVISREDGGNDRRNKGLDLVPADERTVIVVDDRTDVWENHLDNLIHIEPYNFFAAAGRCSTNKSLSELREDEMVDNGGGLAGVLDILRRAHQAFFDDTDVKQRRDVRVVLREMRRRVLEGCRIVITRKVKHYRDVRLMAVKMGAKYVVADTATHVVESKTGTKAARWSVAKGKFLVTPGWVEAAYYTWRRPKEEDYIPMAMAASRPTTTTTTPQTENYNITTTTTQTENYNLCCCCVIM